MNTSLPHHGHDTRSIVVQGASSLPMQCFTSRTPEGDTPKGRNIRGEKAMRGI